MQTIFDMKICVIYNRPRQLIGGGNHKRGSMGHNVTNLLVHCSWRLTNHIPVSTNPPSQPQHIARPLHHIPALCASFVNPSLEPCGRYHHSPKLQTTCQTFALGTATKPHAAFTTPGHSNVPMIQLTTPSHGPTPPHSPRYHCNLSPLQTSHSKLSSNGCSVPLCSLLCGVYARACACECLLRCLLPSALAWQRSFPAYYIQHLHS
jgi:hypothetical protein